jgi:hypothetical protein
MDKAKPSFTRGYDLIVWSFQFYGSNFIPLLGLMLVAALGRAVQMKAVGEITSGQYLLLEIAVELSRVLLVVLVLGEGNIKRGFRRCKRAFTMKKYERKALWNIMVRNFKAYWPALLWNFTIFCMLAFLINYCIEVIASNQSVLLWLKDWHILHASASANPVVFLLKNFTVIPFTIIFEFGILLRLMGKI